MTGIPAMKAFGSMAAMLMMLLGVLAIPSNASAGAANLSDQLTTDTGTTTDLGGGSYFFVRFGTDAAFGIVWGTDTVENNVYFVAIKARYLGVAQVYDSDGDLVVGNHTVKIYTMYAVKLESMLEFNDTNDNSLLQYHRVYQNYNFTGDYVSAEPLYKKVDLKTSWDSSPAQYAETEDDRTWSFDLTANDLPYEPLQNYTGPTGDDKLNNLTLTFHLTASMIQVDNASLPQWRITVQKGPMGNMMMFYDAQRLEDIQVSGKMLAYNVKWDQTIEGWDYDATNGNPMLLMEFGALVGNFVPVGAATWMHMNMVRQMNEYGYMVANEGTSSEIQMTEQTGTLSQVRTTTQNRLTFGGESTRIGRFEWVSNVTVDGNQEQLHVQLMAGMPVWAYGNVGGVPRLFAGFAVLGGVVYPGGEMIVHDPTVSAESLVDVSTGDDDKPGVFLLIIAIVAAVVIIAVVALVLMEKKPGQKVQQSYEKTLTSEPGAWAKYYNKK